MKLKRVREIREREKGESKLTRAFISGYTEHTQKWLFFSQKKMFLFYPDCDIGLPVSIALLLFFVWLACVVNFVLSQKLTINVLMC